MKLDAVLYADRKIVDAERLAPDVRYMTEDVGAAFEHWRSLAAPDEVPHFDGFHLDDLQPSVIPSAILYEVVDGGGDYLYRFFGSQRVLAHGEDYTGRRVSDMEPKLVGLKIASELDRIRETVKPLMVKTTASVFDEEFHYWMLRLPFRGADGDVSHLLAIAFNGTGPEVPDRLVRGWFRP